MRCVDVTRELSAPTGLVGSSALRDHLAGCPRCATWAEQSARVDRLWEATRPGELSDAAWDRIWSNVSEALDRPLPALRLAPAAPRPWHRSALAAFVLAEAAAILLGFATLLRTTTGHRPPQAAPAGLAASAPADLAPEIVEIDPEQVVLIHWDDRTVRALPQSVSPYSIDPFLPMFNYTESLASLQ
jgi:hypothetical protein